MMLCRVQRWHVFVLYLFKLQHITALHKSIDVWKQKTYKVSFHYFLVTSMTNWAQTFTGLFVHVYVESHKMWTLILSCYQKYILPLKTWNTPKVIRVIFDFFLGVWPTDVVHNVTPFDLYFRSKPEVENFNNSYLKNYLSYQQNFNISLKTVEPAQTFTLTWYLFYLNPYVPKP